MEVKSLRGRHALNYPKSFSLRIQTFRLTIVIGFEIERVAVAVVCLTASDRYCSSTYWSLRRDKVDFGVDSAFVVAAGG